MTKVQRGLMDDGHAYLLLWPFHAGVQESLVGADTSIPEHSRQYISHSKMTEENENSPFRFEQLMSRQQSWRFVVDDQQICRIAGEIDR